MRALRQRAQVREHRVDVWRPREDVRPEPQARAVPQFEDRSVPEQRLVRRAAQHEPRPAAHVLPAPLHPPASLQPQVAAQHDAAVEREEEVLADGLHRLERAPVQALGDVLDGGARIRRDDLDPLADERLQAPGRARKCVSLRHADTLARE